MTGFKKSKYDGIIVGLGNPGDKYGKTRHNAGFRTVDILAEMLSASPFKNKFHSLVADAETGGKKLLLCKPLTFMNESGTAVSEILKFYKCDISALTVISDDVSMDAGRLRIRAGGSHGGHNGLRDIIELCGTDAFCRVKIGVGCKPRPDYDLAAWVLGVPDSESEKKISEAESDAAKAIIEITENGVSAAMNKFNR